MARFSLMPNAFRSLLAERPLYHKQTAAVTSMVEYRR